MSHLVPPASSNRFPVRSLLALSLFANVLLGAWYVEYSDGEAPGHDSLEATPTRSLGSSRLTPQLPPPEQHATQEANHLPLQTSPESRSLLSGHTAETQLQPSGKLIDDKLDALGRTVPDGVQSGFQNPVGMWHRVFMEDTADDSWSLMAQSQTEVYLGNRLGSNIDLIGVKCSASVCEIQAASVSAATGEVAANAWQQLMSAMSGEDWWSTYGFDAPNSAIWRAEDGRALFVSYLTRKGQ